MANKHREPKKIASTPLIIHGTMYRVTKEPNGNWKATTSKGVFSFVCFAPSMLALINKLQLREIRPR